MFWRLVFDAVVRAGFGGGRESRIVLLLRLVLVLAHEGRLLSARDFIYRRISFLLLLLLGRRVVVNVGGVDFASPLHLVRVV